MLKNKFQDLRFNCKGNKSLKTETKIISLIFTLISMALMFVFNS